MKQAMCPKSLASLVDICPETSHSPKNSRKFGGRLHWNKLLTQSFALSRSGGILHAPPVFAGPRASGVLWASEPGRTCSMRIDMHGESGVVLLWIRRASCFVTGYGRERSLCSGRPAEGISFFLDTNSRAFGIASVRRAPLPAFPGMSSVTTVLRFQSIISRTCRAIHGAASLAFLPSVPASAVGLLTPVPLLRPDSHTL